MEAVAKQQFGCGILQSNIPHTIVLLAPNGILGTLTQILIVTVPMHSHITHALCPVTTSRSMYTFPCSPSSSVCCLRAEK